jgi:transposase, IS5 family
MSMLARSARDGWASPWSSATKPRSSTTPTGSSSTTTSSFGNPPDAPQLAPAVARITTRTGHTPRAVTADRGYGQASVERDLRDLGVRSVAIPRTSKPTAARREFEHRRAFREKVKWRTGSEGRINHIKRSYGWNRTELTGINGVRTWYGHGVFAHNLVKIGALAA